MPPLAGLNESKNVIQSYVHFIHNVFFLYHGMSFETNQTEEGKITKHSVQLYKRKPRWLCVKQTKPTSTEAVKH